MKRFIIHFSIIFSSFLFKQISAQVYNYTWMKGTNFPYGGAAVYGTMGVSSPSNTPGYTSGGITWTDQSGNLWLYSTLGSSVMWKYSPSTNNWTWINGSASGMSLPVYGTMGVSSTSTTPGLRGGSASWTDASGNLWLFGGHRYSNGDDYNDLWRYSIANNQWTWMGGSNTPHGGAVYGTQSVPSTTNIPRASSTFISWKDPAGNFWLYDQCYGTVVWKYNPSNGQWAWMSGASNNNSVFYTPMAAVYGTMGISSSTVHPGARYNSSGVADAAGNLYLFGGRSNTLIAHSNNDLWKYTISTNQWTWISGNAAPVSGTQGVFSSSTIPNYRNGHAMWADNNNNKLWIFGGLNNDSAGYYVRNDTWCYNISTGQWAWMKGSNQNYMSNGPGPLITNAVYGTQTVASPFNTPGWTGQPSYWGNDPSALWLYSGDLDGVSDDLWKLNGCTINSTVGISSSHTVLCAGSMATLAASGSTNSVVWNTGAQTNTIGVTPSITSVYAVGNSGTNCANVATFTLAVIPNPTISVIGFTPSSTPSLACAGSTWQLNASGASTYTWNTGSTNSSILVTPISNTTYTVNSSNLGCQGISSISIAVIIPPLLTVNVSPSITVCMGSNINMQASGNFTSYTWSSGTTVNSNSINITPSANVSYTINANASASACPNSSVINIAVRPNPTISVSSSSSLSCSGSTVALNASGAASYAWSSGATGSLLQVSPLASTVYTITGTTNGCITNKTFTQQVQALPVVVISSSTNQICSGNPLILSASGASSYLWSTGANSSSIIVTPTSNTSYSLIGFQGSCQSNTSTSIFILNPTPVTVSVSPSNTVCFGNSISLEASGNFTSFTWSSGTVVNGNSISITPSANVIYTLFANASANACANASVINIVVKDNPITTINLVPTSCSNTCNGKVFANSSGGSSPYSYSLSGTTCTTIPCMNLCAGFYSLITTDSLGCKNHNFFSITNSLSNILANITTTHATCFSCNNGVLSVNPVGGSAPYTYSWTPSGGTTSTASNLTPGCYTLTITDAGGCSTNAWSCVGIGTGINGEVIYLNEMLLFPNPTKGLLNIQLDGFVFDYRIYNNLAQLVNAEKNINNNTAINIKEFSNGIYFVEISVGNAVLRKKIIKD